MNSWLTWDLLLPYCLWAIWITRNDNLFTNHHNFTMTDGAISEATDYTLLAKNKTNHSATNKTISIKWNPPKYWSTKLITDRSAMANPRPRCLGDVFRRSNEEWILGFYQHIPQTTLTMDKLLALRCGLLLSKEHNVTSFDINMDSVVAINILTNDHPLYHNIVYEYRILLAKLEAATPVQIYREQNPVAGCLAKEGTKMEFMEQPNIVHSPPSLRY